MIKWYHIEGVFLVFAGIYGYLLANGTFPKNPKDPAKMELWRKKFGKLMKILCPFIIIFGATKFFGIIK